jgi:class 3 adenylate cyclase/tetratricopeptide (TPR) repeat protein
MVVCRNCGEENPARFRLCGFCGTPLPGTIPTQEVRKTVTIVFSDLKGSTALGETLDPESLREVMSEYFREMRAALERHGGRVEKYIGDAIMAVFGLPKAHEDDALRAVRAAAAMREALAQLNVELERRWGVQLVNRTGVNTGEVIAADAADAQRLVTGDAVNVAARLEQAAPACDVLIGEPTYRLVRDSVDVEPVEPLELKGKLERVNAYRLIAAREGPQRRHRDAPLIGRRADLGVLSESFELAAAGSGSWTVTILGEAGLGKTRLAEELIGQVRDRALVVRGRCLAYGDGITFWPLVEVVRQAAGIDDGDQTEAALAKLAHAAGDAEVAARVAAAVGLSVASFPLPELYWGVRKLFERLAEHRPLVVFFDDLHWAESAFLDLLDHLTTTLAARIVLVCASRPELFDDRRLWADRPHAATVTLAPLGSAESAAVIENLLGDVRIAPDVLARVVDVAEGNPLFVEQLLAMLVDDGLVRRDGDSWVGTAQLSAHTIPPTIQALLAARLDGLEREERSVVEPAAVIGHVFPTAAVRELVPELVAVSLDGHLSTLTRKRIVRSAAAEGGNGGVDGELFRFHHVLIRDATYETLLKRTRATFHERFVQWAERVNGDRVHEYDEIHGYHLEQAYRYLAELGPLDDRGRQIGADAARRLAAAGRRALARGDCAAAANLLERATNLLPELDAVRLDLLPDLAETLIQLGRFAESEEVLERARGAAAATGDVRLEARADLLALLVSLRAGDSGHWTEDAVANIGRAIGVFEAANDDSGLAKAWRVAAYVHGIACQYGETAAASLRALEYAEAAGEPREQAASATGYALAATLGPTPVPEAIQVCDRMLAELAANRAAQGWIFCCLAQLHAMRGEFDHGRELYVRGRSAFEEIGGTAHVAWAGLSAGRVEILAGDVEAAERALRSAVTIFESMGERYYRSTATALLARAVYAQRRLDEAEELSLVARDLAGDDDVSTQALWRSVVAQVLADRGDFAAAGPLVQDALQLVLPTDSPVTKIGALIDVGQVFSRAGVEAASWAFEEAIRIAERKGNLVAVAEARRHLGRTTRPAQSSPLRLPGAPVAVGRADGSNLDDRPVRVQELNVRD